MTNVSNVRQSPVICCSAHVQFLKKILRGDESWGYEYDPETKHQSSSGRVPRLREKRRGTRCEANKGHVTSFFLILSVSYTTRTLPTGKQLTRNSTWRSCDFCVNQFAEKDRKNCGMATGSCTTTMCPHKHTHTHPYFTSCAGVFGQTRHRSVSAAAILTRSRTV